MDLQHDRVTIPIEWISYQLILYCSLLAEEEAHDHINVVESHNGAVRNMLLYYTPNVNFTDERPFLYFALWVLGTRWIHFNLLHKSGKNSI